jgi:hypothetical protein
MNDLSAQLKKCKRCGTLKPKSEFYACPTTADRKMAKCMVCMRTLAKERYHRKRNASGIA